MLTFYQARKWMLPALASRNDLSLLKEISEFQPKDQASEKKQKHLVNDFHQATYLTTIGSVIAVFLIVFCLVIFFESIISFTEESFVTLILILASAAIVPFCQFLRIFTMWQIRRKFEKLKKDCAL